MGIRKESTKIMREIIPEDIRVIYRFGRMKYNNKYSKIVKKTIGKICEIDENTAFEYLFYYIMKIRIKSLMAIFLLLQLAFPKDIHLDGVDNVDNRKIPVIKEVESFLDNQCQSLRYIDIEEYKKIIMKIIRENLKEQKDTRPYISESEIYQIILEKHKVKSTTVFDNFVSTSEGEGTYKCRQ